MIDEKKLDELISAMQKLRRQGTWLAILCGVVIGMFIGLSIQVAIKYFHQ